LLCFCSSKAARWPYIIGSALVVLFFIADIVLPRGATAAIGYCLVPVILGGRRPRAPLGATILSTVLTAVGFWWEPRGGKAWTSIFDRTMVAGVLWLAFFLVKRRAIYMHALIEPTRLLQITSFLVFGPSRPHFGISGLPSAILTYGIITMLTVKDTKPGLAEGINGG
jgi:hypothetical protein